MTKHWEFPVLTLFLPLLISLKDLFLVSFVSAFRQIIILLLFLSTAVLPAKNLASCSINVVPTVS